MKAAIYCRLSEEDRNKQFETDDSNSIQNQKAMLLQYAMEQGWEVYNLYSDDDYTGSDRRRPEFNRLLEDAKAHRFDIVLCKTQSRFTRELELVEKYIHGLFPIWGIRFVSIVDNADTANKGNKKSRQINGLVNEWYRVEGTHEAIIDRPLWNRVQSMIAERAKPFDCGTVGLFARKAICANCGYTMRSSKNRGRHYLQCSNRHVAKDACIGSFISVEKLERMVIDELNRLVAAYLDKDELERSIEFCESLQGQKRQLLDTLSAYEKRIAEYTKGLRDLYMDKVKGLLNDSDFSALSKEFSSEKSRLERILLDGQRQLAELENRIAVGDNRKVLVERYVNLEHLTREIVEILIDHITIGKRIPGTRDVLIEIHWNF